MLLLFLILTLRLIASCTAGVDDAQSSSINSLLQKLRLDDVSRKKFLLKSLNGSHISTLISVMCM